MNKWTDEQLKAITTTPNVLVSAAAGSGKTAVLVERIIQKLITPDDTGKLTDITELLVVTFARDAAGEMQERVKKVLTELMHSASDTHLKQHCKKQLKIINQADITTIDSFCINAVRKNFHFLDIDPSFRIMDKTDADILKLELADELCMIKYDEDDEDFLLLNKLYSSAGNDYALINLIINIYNFTRSLPYPDDWLDNCIATYNSPFSGSLWERYAISIKNSNANKCMKTFKKAYAELSAYGFPEECSDEFSQLYTYVNNMEKLCEALKKADYDKTHFLLSEANLNSPQKSKKKNSSAVFINEIIDIIRPDLNLLCETAKFFTHDSSGQEKIAKSQSKVISALVKLCKELSDLIFNTKLEKNMFEFNDFEHMCLKLFSDNPMVAEEYRDKYKEILMDEYQDTNGLQEAIFNAIPATTQLMVNGKELAETTWRDLEKEVNGHGKNFYTREQVADIARSVMPREEE